MQPVSCFSGIEAVLGECGGAWAGTCNHTTGSCSCAAGWSGHSDVLPMDLSQWGGSVLACHVHVPTVKVICRRGAGCRTRSGFGERVVSRRHSWGYLGTSCGLWDSVGHEWSLSVHRISCQATEEDVGIAFRLYPQVPPPFRGRGGRVSVGLDLATVSANTEISRGAFLIPVLSFSSHSPSFNPFDCTGPLGAELCRDRRNRVGLPESGVRAEAPLCAQTSKKTERLDPRALHVWATGTASISMVKIVLTIDRSTYIPATTRMHVCG